MFSPDMQAHLEKYWQLCRHFYRQGDYALAGFLSITLIEELGKVIILGNRELGAELDKKGFYDHKQKYAYAVYETLLVNSRVTRVYGDQEGRFAAWFKERELFNIRNRALYMDLGTSTATFPHKEISKQDAFLLICLAGEIYAEIQGFFTDSDALSWEAIIGEIDTFREESGISAA